MAGQAGGKTIPKLIHQLWKDSEPPARYRAFQKGWRELNPGWQLMLWTDADLAAFVAKEFPDFLPVFQSYTQPICRADAARYLILRRLGGLYVDLDFECLRPVEPLLAGRTLAIGLEPDSHLKLEKAAATGLTRLLCPSLIASVPGHPFWDQVIAGLRRHAGEADVLDATGPFLLTRTFEAWAGRSDEMLLPAARVYPADKQECWDGRLFDIEHWARLTQHAHALHHWDGTWFRDAPGGQAADAVVKPRRLSVTVTEGSVPAPPAEATVQAPAPPRISCLMATRDRPAQALLAIECFRRQTYPDRELVIIDGGGPELRQAVERLGDPRIRWVAAPDANLGEARNLAVHHAVGTLIAQWDDDDLYDPLRLEIQYAALLGARARACLLSRWTIWWPGQDRVAVSGRRAWEGSLLCEKAVMPAYPPLPKGEDTPAIEALIRRVRVAHLDLPRLYLYSVHGANTFGSGHFEYFWDSATARFDGADAVRVGRELGKRLPLARYLDALTPASSQVPAPPVKPPLAPRPPAAPSPTRAPWEDLLARTATVLRDDPGNARAKAGHAGALLGLERLDEAEALFRELLVSAPGQPFGADGLARVAGRRRRWAEALERWDAVLREFPAHWPGLLARADAYLEVGRFADARRDYEAARVMIPDQALPRIGIAETAARERNWDIALTGWREVLREFPDHPTAVLGSVTALIELGRLDEAEAVAAEHLPRLERADGILLRALLLQRRQGMTELAALLADAPEIVRANITLRNLHFHVRATTGDLSGAGQVLAGVAPDAPLPPWAEAMVLAHGKDGITEAVRTRLLAIWRAHGAEILSPELLSLLVQVTGDADPAEAERLLALVEAMAPANVRAIRLGLLGIFERLRIAAASGTPPEAGADSMALRELAGRFDPRVPFGDAAATLRRFADRFDALRLRHPDAALATAWRREDAEAVVERILTHHRNGKPMSLLRLGDGEGNFLPYPTAQHHHAAGDRAAAQSIWWGRPRLSTAEQNELSTALQDAVRNADIVGVPDLARLCYGLAVPTPGDLYQSWHDFRGLLAILDHLDGTAGGRRRLIGPQQMLTSCHIHADLAAWGLYETLFAEIGEVALVTCHGDLAGRLRERFGLAVSRSYLVPHEKKYSAIFGYADKEEHYPDFYRSLKQELRVERPGEVFLVAAGFLGKMYADWIKARGGIAIDVGSVVDYWCGHTTRTLHFVQRFAAAPRPKPSAPAKPAPASVLVLTPVRNARHALPAYLAALQRLDHPADRLSLAFLEGDSEDGSFEFLQQNLAELRRRFRRVELIKHDQAGAIPSGAARWSAELQPARRAAIARARNRLLSAALRDEDWVLWIDADVVDYPPHALQSLLAADRPIVVPHCVLKPGGPTFDLNSFQFLPGGEADARRHLKHGLVQPPRGAGRRYLESLRGQGVVPLDSVGGTMLLVRADLHREGLTFPAFSHRGYIETEGLAMIARELGVACAGLPDLEVLHADR